MDIKPITIVGCGPGGAEHLTPAALAAIRAARVLAGARVLLDRFPSAGETRIPAGADIAGALDALAPHVTAGGVVVLVTGDPGVCSLARPVIRRFGFANCRVLPGISSIQMAFAAVGAEWFGARMLSAHDTAPPLAPESLTLESKICLLAGNPANAVWVGELVKTLTPTHHIYLCENLTLPNESVRQLIHREVPMKPASRSIFIFIRKEVMQ